MLYFVRMYLVTKIPCPSSFPALLSTPPSTKEIFHPSLRREMSLAVTMASLLAMFWKLIPTPEYKFRSLISLNFSIFISSLAEFTGAKKVELTVSTDSTILDLPSPIGTIDSTTVRILTWV